jgi:catalase
MITPEEAIDRLGGHFGVFPGMRTLHARGVVCAGRFLPAPEAAALTRAEHMRQEVPVLARISNGSGDPRPPDRAPDVRGLAVSFELPDGSRTDILSQTAPRFPVRTPDAFVELVEATERGLGMAWKLPLFLARNPWALPALRANAAALRPPASYAEPSYYAIHAYRWIDAEGAGHWVRYVWRPCTGNGAERSPEQGREDDYLTRDLRERLADGPVRFDLELQIAGEGDDPHDPMSVWGSGDGRVIAGCLEIDSITEGHDEILFDPMRLTDGIEPSEDPILHFRPGAYAVSYERRTGS